MRRIKRLGKEVGKAMKGEEHGRSTVSNRVRDSRVVDSRQETKKTTTEKRGGNEMVDREPEREVPRERYDSESRTGLEEDPPVNKHIEHEIMRGPNIAAELDEKDSYILGKTQVGRLASKESNLREDAFAAVGELSAVLKKIVYWTDQTEVQEVLWYAIEHEKDRYVRHILETVLAQVERTPEPKV